MSILRSAGCRDVSRTTAVKLLNHRTRSCRMVCHAVMRAVYGHSLMVALVRHQITRSPSVTEPRCMLGSNQLRQLSWDRLAATATKSRDHPALRPFPACSVISRELCEICSSLIVSTPRCIDCLLTTVVFYDTKLSLYTHNRIHQTLVQAYYYILLGMSLVDRT